jgi:anti-anti-sigma factor
MVRSWHPAIEPGPKGVNMELKQETRESSLVVAPRGVVDHDSAPAFEEQLHAVLTSASEGGLALIIDMTGVEYMSTVGLRVLMRASKRAREMPLDIKVANMNACMKEIFEISRFDKVIPVFDSVDAAVAG